MQAQEIPHRPLIVYFGKNVVWLEGSDEQFFDSNEHCWPFDVVLRLACAR
jgi:hypothetical protein